MKSSDIKSKKPVILIILFFITAIITYITINLSDTSPVTTSMSEATLPVIMMRTENGTLFNELHGYTSDVDASLLNDSITPLPDDKKLSVVINNYGETIDSVSYKIRELDDLSLIENTTVTDFTNEGNSMVALFNIKNLIDNNTEYLMEINISTQNHETIKYYTKIIYSTNIGLQDKIDFVMNFNACTFDSSRLDEISGYLETKASADNTNYGKVNINSSKAMVGWGELYPMVEMTIVPTIKEINSEVSAIYMEYQMAAQNSSGSYDTYNVNEYYRIRQSGGKIYLLNYEREANQIFDSKNDLTQNTKVTLGITSNQDIDKKSSANGNYSCFVDQGTLWELYGKDSTFTKVFSFDSESDDQIRETYNKHDIKVMDVDDQGNVNFIVYGYMNRGAHEGEVGVSLCTYNYESNQVHERLYIPVDVPFDVLQENVGEIAYVSDSNIFYIMLDNTLYSIDLTSKEKMVEVSNLTDATHAVSQDGSSIAYSTNGEEYNTDVIRIFNIQNASSYEIKAPEGDKVKILGYINSDCVYGIAHESDITTEADGTVSFPMYKIEIMNNEYQVIKDYQQDGIYISSATVSGMRLNLSRVVKNASGNYESIAMDQLINKDENDKENTLTLETSSSDKRATELYLVLPSAASGIDKASMRSSKEVIFTSGETIQLDAKFQDKGRYYVYGYGKFQGSYTSLERAITKANDTYGTVLNTSGDYIWKRYRNTSASIAISGTAGGSDSLAAAVKILLSQSGHDVDAAAQMVAGKSALEVIDSTEGKQALNMKGVPLDNILSFLDEGIPVIGRIGDSSYAILTGYDAKNVEYLDVSTGASVSSGITDASKVFAQWGNMFITAY